MCMSVHFQFNSGWLRYKFWLGSGPLEQAGWSCACIRPHCLRLPCNSAGRRTGPSQLLGLPSNMLVVLLKCSRADEVEPVDKHCRVSGAHDHRVFWKFVFGVPLHLEKRKPVFCVQQTSAVTCIHKQVLLQATKRFPTQIFTLLRTF